MGIAHLVEASHLACAQVAQFRLAGTCHTWEVAPGPCGGTRDV